MISNELRCELDPAERPAVPVQERDGSALAAGEPAQAGSLHGGKAPLNPLAENVVATDTVPPLFCGQWF